MEVAKLKQVFAKWQTELGNDGWNSLFWNNHDLPRMISRWGNDQEHWLESSKLFAILLHMMKGTPYIYQGEEIGMTNTPITDIREARDIETINMYHEYLEKGYSKEEILLKINTKGRDNARRPMQWTAEKMRALRLVHLGLMLILIIKRLTSLLLWQIKIHYSIRTKK